MRYVLKCGAVFVFLFAVVLAPSSTDAAYTGSSNPEGNPPEDRTRILQNEVLVLETIDTTNSIQLALSNLGVRFDLITSADWTGIDFSPYETVIVAMDGGLISQASVQAIRTGVIDIGKRACFVGGSNYSDFVAGVNNSIIGIDTVNHGWAVSVSPHFTVTDPTHYLAHGLPSPTDFVGSGAPFYMARLTDGDMEVVATNGDAQPCLVAKVTNFPGGGTGDFRWFINTASEYWSHPSDFAFLQRMMANLIADRVLVVETTDTTDSIQLALVNLGVPFDLVSSDDWVGIDFNPYDIVIAGLDGGFVSEASVQAIRTGVIDAGKRARFVGGSAMDTFANGVNNSIIGIDTVTYSWAMSAAPNFTVTDPAHFLAQGLPSPTTFVEPGAAYYMARLTDADMEVVAVNGDGWPCLVSKLTNFPGGGDGDFKWFINTARPSWWSDPGDLVFFQKVVANLIADSFPPFFVDGFELGDTLAWSVTFGLLGPATCTELWTDMDVWGWAAAGIDLRSRTNSTLHWIGCPGNGCDPAEFYCVDDPGMETLTFGTSSADSLRAVIDPGNAGGDTMPTSVTDCSSAAIPMDVTNAPTSDCNGSGIDCITALCHALGFQTGVVLREVDSNNCPEPHSLNSDGTDWTSDFVLSSGFGAEYQCSGFAK